MMGSGEHCHIKLISRVNRDVMASRLTRFQKSSIEFVDYLKATGHELEDKQVDYEFG